MWDSMCCVNLIMCMLTHVCMTHMKTIVRLDQPAPSRVRGIAHLLYRKSVNWRWWCWKEIYAAICQCLFSGNCSPFTFRSPLTYCSFFLLPLTTPHSPICYHLHFTYQSIATYKYLLPRISSLIVAWEARWHIWIAERCLPPLVLHNSGTSKLRKDGCCLYCRSLQYHNHSCTVYRRWELH